MTSVGLVVARYNESLTWLNELYEQNSAVKIYVYNKGNTDIEQVYAPIEQHDRLNVGNEAETYLWHMLRMAHRLNAENDAVTLFVQGNPYDHVHKEHLYRIIHQPDTVKDFEWLAYHILDCKVKNECHHRGLPITEFYHELLQHDIPQDFLFGVGGMFAARDTLILNAGVDRLTRARDLVIGTYKDDEPWCILERIWDKVLTT